MAVSPPSVMLKIIWMAHFVLSSWAQMSGFIQISTYWYTHVAVLAFGFWAIVANESADAVLMFLATLVVSILNDILCLALWEPRGHDSYDRGNVPTSLRNEYRFALGMCITNLILKPLTAFLLYRIYQSRVNGTDFDTGIPGLGSAGFGGSRETYDNIDESRNYPGGYGRTSDPPQYQAPTYQEPPPTTPSPAGDTYNAQK